MRKDRPVNAIKEAQRFIAKNPETETSRTLAQLVLTLESKEPYPLEKLYALNLDRFDLALNILKEWRLGRYFAGKSKLYDLSLQIQEQGPQDRTSHFGPLT